MFQKSCSKCGMPATVELQDQLYCTQHGFDKVVAMKGPVPKLKSLR